MAHALVDAGSGALGARTDALERGALVDVGELDVEVVGAHAVVVDGVGDGRTQDLGDVLGDRAGVELQDLERLGDGKVADETHDGTGLAGSDANVLGGRADLVGGVVSHLVT